MTARASELKWPSETMRLVMRSADRFVGLRLAAATLTVIAGGVVAALAPLALKDMVDVVAGASRGRHLDAISVFEPAAGYLLALCTARLLMEVRPLLASAAEQRLCARLTQQGFEHLLSLPISWHTTTRTGAAVQVIRQATTGTQVLLASLVGVIGPALVELATVATVMMHLGHPEMVMTFVAAAMAYFCVFAAGAERLRERAASVSDAGLNVQAALTESLQNCETLKSCNAEREAGRRLATGTHHVEANWSLLHRQRTRLGMGAAAVFAISLAASLILAVRGVADGQLSVGGFVLANVYLLQVLRPLESLGASARDVLQALQWIRPLAEVMAMAPESGRSTTLALAGRATSEQAKPARHTRAAPSVSFCSVRFGYEPGRFVLDGLSLHVEAGKTVAIVGVSGSGKSSLVRLLLRLYEPSQGHILLDESPLDHLSIDSLRAQVSLVPQDITLFNDSIAANIAMSQAGAPHLAIEYAAKLACLHDYVESLPDRYHTVVGERGLKLSGGQRQRIAIARAILQSPRLYLLDEATSMLDSATEAAILSNLREASAGCTTLVIAHRLSSIAHADEIIVLDGGRVAERGRHSHLLATQGVYARLWRIQRTVSQ